MIIMKRKVSYMVWFPRNISLSFPIKVWSKFCVVSTIESIYFNKNTSNKPKDKYPVMLQVTCSTNKHLLMSIFYTSKTLKQC